MVPTASSRTWRSFVAVASGSLLALAAIGLALAATGSAGAPDAVPQQARAGIEAALRDRVKALLDEKDADGQSFKRATFSRTFRKGSGGTYLVAFHRDTASADKLMTERFELTLQEDPKTKKWTIAKEELKDSYANLYRRAAGEADFSKFASFIYEAGGMKVTASNGTLYRESRAGRVEGITFTANDIKYQYTPTVRTTALLYEKLKRDHASDVLFTPDSVEISCDPTSCDDILENAFTGLAPADGPEAIDPELRKLYEDDQKEIRKDRRENPFSGFRPLLQSDRRYRRVEIAKDSPKRRVGIEYDNWEPREISYWVYGLDKSFPQFQTVYHAYSDESLKSGVKLAELERRDDPEARYYDLTALKGTVNMALEEMETLTADLVYTIKTKRELREIPFFILQLRRTEDEKRDIKDPHLTINSIEDESGREMTWVKGGPSSGIVILPETVPAGTVLSLRVQFENRAGIYAVSPTFSYVSRFGWMPFVRFTDPITNFDMTIKVPARYKVLGIGKKLSDTVEDDVRVTRWTSDSAVEFPSIIFGDYLEAESEVKATKTDGTPIPVTIHVDKLMKTQGAEKQLEKLADQAANSLNLFREVFGVDYPYGKLDMVNDPFGSFYGQSPSSLIYLGNGVFMGDAKAGALLESGRLSKFNREVVPHEVGHQWWGSLIPNFNESNYWFVESLAEYASALYVEVAEGKEAYRDKIAEWRRRVLEADLLASVQDAPVIWTGGTFRAYQAAVYNKGPYAFHIMRATWGDETFFKYLKALAQELKNRPIVTRDIQQVSEQVFGGNMEFFFDQWIRGVGLPEYTFSYSHRETEDGKYLIEGKIDQRVLVGLKKDPLDQVFFTAVVPVTVEGKNGKEYRIPLKVQGPSTPFKFKVNERPSDVTFNKYGEVLAYDVIVKELG